MKTSSTAALLSDAADLDFSQRLTMTVQLLIAFTAFFLEYKHFITFQVLYYLSFYYSFDSITQSNVAIIGQHRNS